MGPQPGARISLITAGKRQRVADVVCTALVGAPESIGDLFGNDSAVLQAISLISWVELESSPTIEAARFWAKSAPTAPVLKQNQC
jgi:hypothetical protein